MTVLALTISLALSLLVAPRLSQAQAPAKVPRVGILTAGPASHPILLPDPGRYCPWYNTSLYYPHLRRV